MTKCCFMEILLAVECFPLFESLCLSDNFNTFFLTYGARFTMVPASLYLGFAASIIWVGQVQLHAPVFLLLIMWVSSGFRDLYSNCLHRIREPTLHQLREVMLKIMMFMKDQ